MEQENYESWGGPIDEYRGQLVNVGKHEIEMSFDLYKSQDRLGWAMHKNGGQPDINQLLCVKVSSATHMDIGQLLSGMVKVETKKSLVPEPLDMYLDNEYLVAMILTKIDSINAP